MNSRELPFREIDGSSFLVLPKGPAGGCQAEPMALRARNRAENQKACTRTAISA